MSFNWRIPVRKSFWDPGFNQTITEERSDRDLLKNPESHSHDEITKALCRVISELMEFAEKTHSEKITQVAKSLSEVHISKSIDRSKPCTHCGTPADFRHYYCVKCGL